MAESQWQSAFAIRHLPSALCHLPPAIPMPKRRASPKSLTKITALEPIRKIIELPLVPVRETVIFPRLISPLTVGREPSVRAIEDAVLRDQRVAVFTQRNPETQD